MRWTPAVARVSISSSATIRVMTYLLSNERWDGSPRVLSVSNQVHVLGRRREPALELGVRQSDQRLAAVRNPPPTLLPPPDHARCSLPPLRSRPTSCLPPPAYGPS